VGMNEIEKMYQKGIFDYLSNEPILTIFYKSLESPIRKHEDDNEVSFAFKLSTDNDELIPYIDFSIKPLFDFTFIKDSDFYLSLDGDFIHTSDRSSVVGAYVPDFIIRSGFHFYAIEIDGHNFHEKTKEQVRQDNQKNRDYLKHGIIPIRFSGSEVYNNPLKCAEETFITVIQHRLHEAEWIQGFIDNVSKN
jgi:very-short-patch-repair endonuclease